MNHHRSVPRTSRTKYAAPHAVVAATAVVVAGLMTAACGTSSTSASAVSKAAVSTAVSKAAPTSGSTGAARDAGLAQHGGALVVPGSVHVDPHADRVRSRRVVYIAQQLYTFWNTGKTRYLDRAITGSFRDNTLPQGRPQGPAGPKTASAQFRAAIPDLTCELPDLYVTGDTFTARLVFKGHFTGVYNGIRGKGQTINFNAIDIQHLGNGAKITEDWHLEDNLTFLQQAGLVSVAGAK